MKILILGDSHGHLDLIVEACQAAELTYGIEAAIQVGDFGFFPKVLDRFLREDLQRFPVPLHVIDGNHEDHAWLTQMRAAGGIDAWAHANLHVHARGSVMALGGARIGFIGGALHADRRQEWSGQWQPLSDGAEKSRRGKPPKAPLWANWVTEGDTERALAAFAPSALDLIVSHSCPAGIGIGISGALSLIEDADRFITRAGFHSGPFHDCGEGGLTRLWRSLPIKPRNWVFGHFHQLSETVIDGTTFTCVGSTDDSDGVAGIRPIFYDTVSKTLHVEPAMRL